MPKHYDKRLTLSAAQVRTIRKRYAGRHKRRITQRELADIYGCDTSTIGQIVLGRSRKQVAGPRSAALGDLATRARGQYNGRAKLSARQVANIRRIYAAQSPKITQTALAERYGVTSVNIHMIVSGKSWK